MYWFHCCNEHHINLAAVTHYEVFDDFVKVYIMASEPYFEGERPSGSSQAWLPIRGTHAAAFLTRMAQMSEWSSQ